MYSSGERGFGWVEFAAKVRGLELPRADYAVFGSGPMLALGLIPTASDVDVLARGAAWEKAKTLGNARRGERDPFIRLAGGVEIFGGWFGMDSDGIISRATPVEGLPFARLEDVLAFKLALGRDKDEEHIRLIREYLSRSPGA